jgi:hypothetical protein
VLGPATADQLAGVLGALPATTPAVDVPPGRGYARLGAGPVHRLQVPSTPDPYDDETGEADREAVLALLPPLTTPAEAERIDSAPSDPVEAEPLDADPAEDAEPVEAAPLDAGRFRAQPVDMKKEPVGEEDRETEPLSTEAVAAEAP